MLVHQSRYCYTELCFFFMTTKKGVKGTRGKKEKKNTKSIKTIVEDHYLYLAPHCKLNTKYCQA